MATQDAHNVAIACQGGGSHAAYAAGALATLLPQFDPRAAAQPLKLVGLSGTSGGAISALLAWYGFLTGGAAEAERKLTAFWDANSARMPGEWLFNTWSLGLADAMPYDLKLSPYLPPLRDYEYAAAELWPQAVHLFGSLDHWVRSSYFSLADSIRPFVDFALVGPLGDFFSIPLDVKRWLAVDLEARVYATTAGRGQDLAESRHLIEQRIVRKLGMLQLARERLAANAVPPDALLATALSEWSESPPPPSFDAPALRDIAGRITRIASSLPQLLIGAVEIDHGRFTAFSSERAPSDGGISVDAVLASAALPWVFRAQPLSQLNPATNRFETRAYWDGLFSQNPPIKDFLTGVEERRKPDDIWVVQINPNDFHTQEVKRGVGSSALSGSQIWHTRDSLSGNLSLNQELAFIDAINRRVASGATRQDRADKHIQVNRIVMDGGAVEAALGGRKLGAHSKLDRAADLKDALLRHGREQAAHFLGVRAEVASASVSLGTMLRALSVREGEPGALTMPPPLIREDEGVRDASLVVDELTVQHSTPDGEDVLANVHWHTLNAHVDGARIRIEGNTGLYRGGRAGPGWRLRNVLVEAATLQ